MPAVRVRLGAATAEGISVATLRRVVRRHLREIESCYARGLISDPSLGGRVVLSCTLSASGGVESCRTQSSTLDHLPTERCMTESANRWTFPGLDGPAGSFTYPFALSPE